ncbi:DUF4426 domain-containing protein [Lysobacter auxotrophicus]|uniref:DUF4426 domain-containing protein n=1 Tax=Lysobacter auxotrophicus TaxID=2992573 RepID=A0ABM8DGJ0_9GAMM|nr:DUF4426 domain-containing protein [Lysobacter auxotrophicus]BDU17713.1 DUF4426 domain-containing protein [Lysobacter auxotrophicus]
MRHVLALSLSASLALAACGGSSAPPAPPSPPSGASATQEAVSRIGDVTIRASAIPTSSLSEQVARQYGIARGDDTVMLLIGVRRGDSAQETALPAQIIATATDLRGRKHVIDMRELRSGEGAAALLDYVGTVDVSPPDTLRFDVQIVREGGATSQMQFSRDVYPR